MAADSAGHDQLVANGIQAIKDLCKKSHQVGQITTPAMCICGASSGTSEACVALQEIKNLLSAADVPKDLKKSLNLVLSAL